MKIENPRKNFCDMLVKFAALQYTKNYLNLFAVVKFLDIVLAEGLAGIIILKNWAEIQPVFNCATTILDGPLKKITNV